MSSRCGAQFKNSTETSLPLAYKSGREADHSPPSSAEVKKSECSYTSPPPTHLHGAVLSLKKAQGQLYFFTLCGTIVVPRSEVRRAAMLILLMVGH
jgi:hypothetical protein